MDMAVQLEREKIKLASIQKIARAVGSTLDIDELLHLIVDTMTDLMSAERSTLYVVDAAEKCLWTKVLQADEIQEIRLKMGEGIAGWVAECGKTLNIPDVYEDERFSPNVDQQSGYRTRSMLCAPMHDSLGKVIGVVQVLNKKNDVFSAEDQDLFEALASQAAIAVENSQLYVSVVRKNEELVAAHASLERRVRELDLLLDVEQHINEASALDILLERLLSRTKTLIGAEAASILLHDEEHEHLCFTSALGERGGILKQIKVAVGEGIVGWVAQNCEAVVVSDPENDPRHCKRLAGIVGFAPRNIVCAPLIGQRGVLGAIELLNKVGTSPFDEGDLRVLQLVASRIANAIELTKAHEEDMRQQRLATIGQMLSGLVHDLKTPMTVISGYAQLMAQSDEENTRTQYVEQILRQFDMMSAMAREVLAFARGETNILMRKVYLNRFMDEMRQHLDHLFADDRFNLVVENEYTGVAYFDESKLRRVFQNIARNAVQAMPNGGQFKIAVDAKDNQLKFQFSDTGPGIPKEIEGRLFDLFATAGKEDGTGLGLAIVKKIVDDHGGEINYLSESNKGTTFNVSLPLRSRREGTGAYDAVDGEN